MGEEEAVEKKSVADSVPAMEAGETEMVSKAAVALPVAGTEVAVGNDGGDDSDMEMD